MVISDLSVHPHLTPQLVDAFFAEWPSWCSSVGRRAVEAIFAADPPAPLPVILVMVSPLARGPVR